MDWFWFILSLLLFGLVVGLIARLLVRRSGINGCITTSLLGVVGSLIGGIVGRLVFGDANLWASWALSIVGAVLLALLIKSTNRPRRY